MGIRREWEEHVTTRMDAEKLVKITKSNIPAGRRFPRRPKRRWSELIPSENRRTAITMKNNKYTAYWQVHGPMEDSLYFFLMFV